MPLDPHVQGLIEALGAQGLKSFEEMSVDEARGVVGTFTGLQAPRRDVAKALDAVYAGPGGELPLRIYVPEGDDSQGNGPLPVVVYFHGGGFVAGSTEVVEEPARALANDAGAV